MGGDAGQLSGPAKMTFAKRPPDVGEDRSETASEGVVVRACDGESDEVSEEAEFSALRNFRLYSRQVRPLELGNSLTAFAAKAFMISCNDHNALTRIRNKIYCFL
ncbi:hypothetical protein DY000_02007837 [Brassica cretica]|uniref:Uncharacterized protein n=1 Tax=Brassica cretica TaxID=69181 RepID=A0ABQ7CEC4_BRACR|nr:hypothetical protein DY000_02007837 [Brassica cretica]